MSDLPISRTTPSGPFEFLSTDGAGSLKIKGNKDRGNKATLVILVCHYPKATHIKRMNELSAIGLISALFRFGLQR
jgi:hypothetical protein